MTFTSASASRRALVQTTIPHDPGDWCVHRFGMLVEQIRRSGQKVDPEFDVACQDYPADSSERAILHQQLSDGYFGQVWLMAPDLDNGPDQDFFEALEAAVQAGTHLILARDHTDLGSSLLKLSGLLQPVTRTQVFLRSSSDQPDLNEYVNAQCPGIQTPCVMTGQNGGVQICRKRADHPLLDFQTLIPGHVVMPAHPHEGVILRTTPSQTVLLSSYSVRSGREQITAILDETSAAGWVLHHSTFHHFADFNLDVTKGAPSFVLDPSSSQVQDSPMLLQDLFAYLDAVVRFAMG
jgi:hypothetical protein